MMNDAMMNEMGSMMAWMMGLGVLVWALIIGLLVTIVVLLVRLLRRSPPAGNARGRVLPAAESREP